MAVEWQEQVAKALDSFRIELPSWGFANTGTRFGKFIQPAAATNMKALIAAAASGASTRPSRSGTPKSRINR